MEILTPKPLGPSIERAVSCQVCGTTPIGTSVRASIRKMFLDGFCALVTCVWVGTLASPLFSQTFSPVPPLSFTKTFGGANPLPQILTITASDASNMRFTVAASTSTGGSWLVTSPTGAGCCFAPEAISVSVNPTVSLAAGSYSGQIVFTNFSNSAITMTVPVTLNVVAAGTAFFDNLQGQASFSLGTGAAAPPQQTVRIRNGAGAGTLGWTLAISTADGNNWLTSTAQSGTAPSAVRIGITPSALPGGGTLAGTFIGQLQFQSASGNVTIPVSVVVGDNVFNQVNPLSFTKPFGGANPLPQVLMVTTTGTTSLRFNSVAVNANGGTWLSVSPSGAGCCFTPETITVSVNATSLAAGTYTAQITFTEFSNNDMAMTVPVTLTVGAAGTPFFGNLPGQLSYSLQTGRTTNPAAQSVQIVNGGTGTLTWAGSASTADGGSWLSLSAATGRAPALVTVNVATASLPGGGAIAGTFVGQVIFQASGSNVTIPVSVVVGDNVFEQLNPINFTKAFGGANPLPQLLTVASTGATSLRFNATANTATGGAWLQISPVGAGCCFTPETITVSVNAVSLPAGTYTGQVVFTEFSNNDLTITVPVTLTVAGGGTFFDNVPGQLSYSLIPGGAAPPAQTVLIPQVGTGTLNWSLTKSTADGGNWLNVSAASGTAPSLVTVRITPANLPNSGLLAGSFVGELVFRAAGSSVSIPVSVAVGPNGFSQANPISFTMPAGGANPLPQTLMINTPGPTSIRFNVAAVTANGGAWLQVSPTGAGCCFTPEALTVSVSGATLAAGTYSGEINIVEFSDNNISLTVPVTLTVGQSSAPFFDNMPGQLTFSMLTGGTAPSAQPVQVRNAGSGTLNWTLGKSTSDGGNWLNVSAASGTAPATVSISINPANLPNSGLIAGTFTGQVVFRTAGDSVTIPVTAVVGDNVFNQVNPVSFTMPFGGANPLPQTLMVTTTGTASVRFNAVAANGTGGNWLQISPAGSGCCFTPEAITLSVNGTGLAAGIYTAEVTFTEFSDNNMSLTVPVTLTVAAAGGPFFDNVPGQLTYSFKTGSPTAPPPQAIQLRNAGTGTLSWALTATTADGGAWLNSSATSGNAPATLTISIVPQNLPGQGLIPGTFVGQLAFRAAGSSVSIPIAVLVGDNVLTQINPASFTKVAGGANPLPQTVLVTSTGTTSLRINAVAANATGGNWLQISPTGSGCCFTPEAITLTVNAASLAAGTYTAQVTFTEFSNNDMSVTVPVTLVVAPAGRPFFDNAPGQMTFSLAPGAGNPPSQAVQIRNGGSGTLSWSLQRSTADGGNWLTTSAATGTAPSSVAVGVNVSALPGSGLLAGTFTGQLWFRSAGSSFTVPVAVTLGTDVFSQLNPLTFSMPVGGPNPMQQMFTVAATGASLRFNAIAYSGKGGAWLTISPQGAGCCLTPATITATVNGTSLASGTYTAQLVFTDFSNNDMTMTVPVTLVVGSGLMAPSNAPVESQPATLAIPADSFEPAAEPPPASVN